MFYLTSHLTYFIYGYMASEVYLQDHLMNYLKTMKENVLYKMSRSSQCSTTGVTKAVVCVILSVDGAYKITLAVNRKE